MNFDPNGSSHLETLAQMRNGTIRSNTQIIEELKTQTINSDESVLAATRLVCELLTKRSYSSFVSVLGPSYWRRDLLEKEYSNGLMCRISTETERQIFMLYEADYGSTRETVQYLDNQRDPHAVPYLLIFVRNALKNIFGSTEKEPRREMLEKLFSAEKPLIHWCEEQKKCGRQLKHFGGQTNTRLGLYHQLFFNIPELHDCLIADAECNIDLGGGFATPEISQGLGHCFTSYDLISPQKAFDWDLHFDKVFGRDAGQAYETHMKELAGQPYQHFDVFTDDFPAHHRSYNIVSFGFINSTVTSLSEEQPEIERKMKKFNTMFFGVLRIIKLARHNKPVVFLTYGRPDAAYMNRLVILRFDGGRITDVVIPDSFLAYQPFAQPTYHTPKVSRDEIRVLSDKSF